MKCLKHRTPHMVVDWVDRCLPDSPKPDSPKLGFRVRVRVSVSANRVFGESGLNRLLSGECGGQCSFAMKSAIFCTFTEIN